MESCYDCKYAVKTQQTELTEVHSTEWVECHRHAPRPVIATLNKPWSQIVMECGVYWPVLPDEEGCGEWQPDHDVD